MINFLVSSAFKNTSSAISNFIGEKDIHESPYRVPNIFLKDMTYLELLKIQRKKLIKFLVTIKFLASLRQRTKWIQKEFQENSLTFP